MSRNKSDIIKIVGGDTQRNQWYSLIYKTNVYQMAKYSNAISQMDFQYFSKKNALHIFKYIFLSYKSGASEI